jgi:hypothetical protein
VIESFRANALALEAQLSWHAGPDSADTRRGERKLLFSWRGEEQFVIFASVQRILKAGAASYRNPIDFGGDFRFETKPMQINRETIADVHRSRNSGTPQANAFGYSGLRTSAQSSGGAAKFAGDINRIAWFRITAEHRFAARHTPATHYVCDNFIEARQVSTSEAEAVFACERE